MMNRIRIFWNWIGLAAAVGLNCLIPGIIFCFIGYAVISTIAPVSGRLIGRTTMLFTCTSQTQGVLSKTELKKWRFEKNVPVLMNSKVNRLAAVQLGGHWILLADKKKPRRPLSDFLLRGSRTEVMIDYQVNGTKYQSSRYYPGYGDDTTIPFWECLEDTKSEVTAGEKYTVYYNPSKPSEAFMVRGWPKGEIALHMILLGVAAAFALIALRSRFCFVAIGSAIYGPLLFLIGPTNVLVSHLHLHLLVILALSLVVWALERRRIVELNLFEDASANP